MKAIILALATIVAISVPAEACVFTALAKVAVKTTKVAIHIPASVAKGTLDGLNYGIGTTIYSTAKRLAR